MAYLLRLTLVLSVVLAALFPMRASANNFTESDQGLAYARCMAGWAAIQSYKGPEGTSKMDPGNYRNHKCTFNGSQYRCTIAQVDQGSGGYQALRACESRVQGSDYYTWESGKTCLARNSTLGAPERVYQGKAPRCVGGCEMTHGGTTETTVNGVTFVGTSETEYSGNTCTLDAGDIEPPEMPGPETPDADEQCTSLGSGQTACVKPDGKYCTRASTGKEFCWNATQTGEQQQGNDLQQRVSGNQRPTTPPYTPPPENESWNPNNSHNSTSPQNGNFTVINYSTTPGDSGNTPANGSPDGGDEGEDEGDPGTVSGGGDCNAPPACNGQGENSAIACAQVLQTWMARCSAVTAGEGIACSSTAPLVCTNMSVMECNRAAVEKKAACASEKISDAVTGELGEGEEGEEVDPMSAWVEGEGEGGEGSGGVDLDQTGWLGSRSCPVLPSFTVMGKTISFSSVQSDMCNFLSVGGMLVLLLAAFQCARILGET